MAGQALFHKDILTRADKAGIAAHLPQGIVGNFPNARQPDFLDLSHLGLDNFGPAFHDISVGKGEPVDHGDDDGTVKGPEPPTRHRVVELFDPVPRMARCWRIALVLFVQFP